MNAEEKPKPVACPVKANFDVLAHHPINTSGGPERGAIDPDDVSTPDLGSLRTLLRAAERAGQTGTPGPHELWVTEIWWESNPPDGFEGVPLKRQARWLEQALYLLWRDGARVVINLQVRDAPFDKDEPVRRRRDRHLLRRRLAEAVGDRLAIPVSSQSPQEGQEEADRLGQAPVGGTDKGPAAPQGRWKKVASVRAGAGEVFKKTLRLPKNAKLRARVGGQQSLVWGGA